MSDRMAHQVGRRELAERLIVEYAGSVAPGQVLAAVARMDRMLASYQREADGRLAMCEQLVRSRLTECAVRRTPVDV